MHHHRVEGNSTSHTGNVWSAANDHTRTQTSSEKLNTSSGLSSLMDPATHSQMYDPMWRSSEDGIMDAFGARGSTWESFTKDGSNDSVGTRHAGMHNDGRCMHEITEDITSSMRHEWEKKATVLQNQYFNIAATSSGDVEKVTGSERHASVQHAPVSTEGSDGGTEVMDTADHLDTGVAPRTKSKRAQVCYKCGAEGHHPATCHVDVQYMMCELHGRRRSEKNLYYDSALGRYQCQPEYQCKTSETRVANKHASSGVTNRVVPTPTNVSSFPMAQQPSYLQQQHTWATTPQMHAIMPGPLAAPYVVSMLPQPSLHPPTWPTTVFPWGGMYGGALALPVPLDSSIDRGHARMPNDLPMAYVPAPFLFNPFGLGRENGQTQ